MFEQTVNKNFKYFYQWANYCVYARLMEANINKLTVAKQVATITMEKVH